MYFTISLDAPQRPRFPSIWLDLPLVNFHWASTLLVLGFSQDLLIPVPTVLEVGWQPLSWTSLGVTTSSSLDDSPPIPSLLHFLSLTDSSSGNQTIQMSGFINVTPPPGQFVPFSVCDKVAPLSSDLPPAPYAYTVQLLTMLNIDPTSSLSFLSYALHGIHTVFAYDNSSAPKPVYTHHWTV